MTRRAFPLLVLLVIFVSAARAQFTWSTSAGSGLFDTAANWSPGLPTANSLLTFGSAASSSPTVTLTSAYSAAGLTFNGSGIDYTLTTSNASTLSLGSGGISNVSSSITFGSALPIALTASQTWTVGSSGGLTVAGPVSGAFGLTKAGSGYLILGGANTFSGGISVSAGTLKLASSSTGAPGAVTSGPVGTGTLNLADDTTLKAYGGNRTLHNAITFSSDSYVTFETDGNDLTLAGILSGDVEITSNGSGRLILSGANTFTNRLIVDNSTVILGTSSVGTVNGSGAVTSITSGPVGIGDLKFTNYNSLLGVTGLVTTLHNPIDLDT
jgi:autotransporter-associated beta strand protein